MEIKNFFTSVTEAETKRVNKSLAGKARDTLIRAKSVVLGKFSSREATNSGATGYDLSRIKKAILTDSYLAVAIRKFSQLITKAGYQIKSKNEEASKYIEDRIRIIEYRSKIPFYILVTSIAKDLYTYSNSYIIKTRDNETEKYGVKAEKIYSGGSISGLFLADPTQVSIQRDDKGSIDHYLINNEEYKPDDVIHLYIDKMNNADYGTSRIFSTLEDVTMLRKAEGLVMTILYRFAIPILHVKVGNVAEGQYATQKEIDDARDAMEDLPNDGFLVTNERTQIEAITPNMQANQLLSFLTYLEERVFTGLNASKSSMGRGGGQNSADNTEALMHDEVRAFQNVISAFLEKYLFTEMLLEGGFNPLTNRDDCVHLAFNEVSIDTKIKIEAHTIQKYQGNLISLPEARRDLGFDNDIDEKEMYAFKVTQASELEVIDAQTKSAIEVANNAAKNQERLQKEQAKTASKTEDGLDDRKFNGKKASNKPNGYFSNIANPQNQNTDDLKTKESLNFIEANTDDNIDEYKKKFKDIDAIYNNLSNILTNSNDISAEEAEIMNFLKKHINEAAKEGIIAAQANNKTNNKMIDPVTESIEEYSSKKIHKIMFDIVETVKNNKDKIYIDSQISKNEYRLRFLCDYVIRKTYWFNYVMQCKADGVKTIEIQFENSKHQDGRMTHFNIDTITIEDIPAYSPYCKCGIKPIMKG